jgi:hypothetical protein
VLIAHHHRVAQRFGAGAHHVDGLRVALVRHEEGVAFVTALLGALAHGHRFGCGGALVEERRVGDVHAGEFHHHRLVIEQRFEAALGDLGLVGRVLGVPTGILQNVALDDAGRERIVVAHADERAVEPVLLGDGAQVGQHFGFAARRVEVQRAGQADALRHGLVDQLVEGVHIQHLQHSFQVEAGRAEVTAREGVQRGKQVKRVVWHGGSLLMKVITKNGQSKWTPVCSVVNLRD